MLGSLYSSDYTFLDIDVLPSQFRETNIGGAENFIRDDCIMDQQAAIDKLNPMNYVTYYNYGKFMQDEFGES